jgi:hypothetical protein
MKDVLSKFPAKEIRKGLETLYKRVEKHFSVEEGRGQLLQVVWRAIQEDVVHCIQRFETLIQLCYSDCNLKLECTIEEVLNSFSEITKSNR